MILASLYILILYFSYHLWPFFIPLAAGLLFFAVRCYLGTTFWLFKVFLILVILIASVMLLSSLYFPYARVRDYLYFFRFNEFKLDLVFYFHYYSFPYRHWWYLFIGLGSALSFFAYRAYQSSSTFYLSMFFVLLLLVGLLLVLLGGYYAYLLFK